MFSRSMLCSSLFDSTYCGQPSILIHFHFSDFMRISIHSSNISKLKFLGFVWNALLLDVFHWCPKCINSKTHKVSKAFSQHLMIPLSLLVWTLFLLLKEFTVSKEWSIISRFFVQNCYDFRYNKFFLFYSSLTVFDICVIYSCSSE